MAPFIPVFHQLLSDTGVPAAAPLEAQSFYDAARQEGLLPLVIDRLAAHGWPGVSDSRRSWLERERAAAVAQSEIATRALVRALGALAAAGVQPLVIKGAALAQTHYARPSLRPRVDTDLLIPERDIEAAHAVFRSLGAEYIPHVTGQYVMSQFHYAIRDDTGCRHVFDVHWRIVNRQVFSAALSCDEMAERAIPLVACGPAARAPSPVDALLLAAIHRAAHHGGGGPLVWLMDIHLLAESLSHAECSALPLEAASRRIAAVTASALHAAHAVCGGAAAGQLAVLVEGMRTRAEPSARFLARRSAVSEAIDDWRSVPGAVARMRLVREWLFPPASYMRETYAPGSGLPLAVLYLVRVVKGVLRGARRA